MSYRHDPWEYQVEGVGAPDAPRGASSLLHGCKAAQCSPAGSSYTVGGDTWVYAPPWISGDVRLDFMLGYTLPLI